MRLPLIVCLLFSLSPTLHAAERVLTVPKAFRGEWNMRRDHCHTNLNDSRLRIDATSLQWYESRARVLAAATAGKNELALIVEQRGEGEVWLSTHHYRLSRDGGQLTELESSPPFMRYRCPPPK